jgi:hypothetical protein
MSKAIPQATGSHNLRMRVVMAMIAVLLVLVVALAFALQPAPTASEHEAKATSPAVSGIGRPSLRDDPYIDRHAEVVARYHQGRLP